MVMPNWLTSVRQVRLRLRHAVLHVHLVGVDVGIHVERDRQLLRAVVRVGGLHVEHVVHPVHLLFERRGDRLLDRDRVSPRVVVVDVMIWGGTMSGELRQRQPPHRNEAGEDGDDGDNHRHDRTPDEEVGNHKVLGSGEWGSGEWGMGNERQPVVTEP